MDLQVLRRGTRLETQRVAAEVDATFVGEPWGGYQKDGHMTRTDSEADNNELPSAYPVLPTSSTLYCLWKE